MGGDAVADAAGIVIEEVGGDDFEVVVGGVGEGAFAVAVTHGPDAGDAGAELVVDVDVAAFVGGDAGFVEAEVAGVGLAAYGEQDMGSVVLWISGVAVDVDEDAVRRGFEGDALGVEADVDAFGFEDLFDGRGYVFVFMRDEARAFFDDGDFAAEAAEDLGEFEADVAAADDDQMRGEFFEVEDGGVDEIGDLVDAGHVGHDGAAADVDEDAIGAEGFRACLDFMRGEEVRLFVEDGAVLHAAQPLFYAVAGFGEDGFFAGFDGLHVDLDCAVDADAEVGGTAGHVGCVGAGDEGFGGDAAGVDAGSAEELALDEGDALAALG